MSGALTRLGQIQMKTADRAGNVATILLAVAHLAGVPVRLAVPLPPPLGLVAALLAVVWLGWQARLARTLLESTTCCR